MSTTAADPGAPTAALIAGCGDIGRRVAQRWQAQGCAVRAWVRSSASAATLQAAGIAAAAVDFDSAPLPPIVAPCLLYCAPPPAEGEDDPRLARVLAACTAAVQRVVYLSTSAVYGDCDGRWIDEDAPLQPRSARGQRRLAAEQRLAAAAAQQGFAALVLRVPGIYGPGRLPRARLAAGQPILRHEDAPYSNRIHADDLAAAICRVTADGAAGQAYNVADGQPTTMSDYFCRCARLLGLPEPPQLTLAEARVQLGAALWSYLEESKRLDTRRLRALGWTPRYADLDTGLRNSLCGEAPM